MKKFISFFSVIIILVALVGFDDFHDSALNCNYSSRTIYVKASQINRTGSNPDTVTSFSYYLGSVMTANTVMDFCVPGNNPNQTITLFLADSISTGSNYKLIPYCIENIDGTALTIENIQYRTNKVTFQAIQSDLSDTMNFLLYFNLVNPSTRDTIPCIIDPKLRVSQG